jgi:hypothetical protein
MACVARCYTVSVTIYRASASIVSTLVHFAVQSAIRTLVSSRITMTSLNSAAGAFERKHLQAVQHCWLRVIVLATSVRYPQHMVYKALVLYNMHNSAEVHDPIGIACLKFKLAHSECT